jgi:hypothetical protein
MFGGVGFLIRGSVACGVHDGELIVRVGPEGHEAALKEAHVRPFDPSAGGPGQRLGAGRAGRSEDAGGPQEVGRTRDGFRAEPTGEVG